MASYTIEIVVKGKDDASDPIDGVTGKIKGMVGVAADAGRGIGGFFRDAFAFATGGLISSGIETITSSLTGAISSGLNFNNSMEMVTAQLNAFTKDGAKSAEILEMIKDRASKTPFEFEAMAQATAALLPTSKASGAALEELIGKAEILAASNPAEGLEGAAFALKEAVSGDFTSIIERFNLPRGYLNQLKEEGVPALQAVQMAMQQVGLDTDLVANLANTASGRWSTFKDTLTGLFAQITQPVFETMSGGLAQVNDLVTANQPKIDAFATAISDKIGSAINFLVTQGVPSLIQGWTNFQPVLSGVIGDFINLADFFTNVLIPNITIVVNFLQTNLTPILAGVAAMLLVTVVPAFFTWAGAASTAAIATMTALAPVIAPIAAIGAAVGVLTLAWQNDWLGIQTTLTGFWNGTGQPIFNQLKTWLEVNIPIGIQTLSNFWTGALKPALDVVWTFITATLVPTFTSLVGNTFANVNNGVKVVSDFWTGTLRPALVAVWSFLDGNVIPIFTAVANVAIALVKLEVRSLAALWNDTLKPALSAVWSFIQTNVMPVFNALVNQNIAQVKTATGELAGFWNGTLKPALDTVASTIKSAVEPALNSMNGAIASVNGAISAIGGVIKSAIGWLNDLAAAINSIPALPDLGGGGGSGSGGGYATGTTYASGALTWVGERGPELMRVPRGAQVYTNRESESMVGGQAVTNNYNFYYPGQSEQDVTNALSMLTLYQGR